MLLWGFPVLTLALMRAAAWCGLGALQAEHGGVEGALIGSLLSHQYVQVVGALVVLLGDPQRQHLLVQEESAQALLAGLPLLLQLPLAQRLLLELPLLRPLLSGWRERDGGGVRERQRVPTPTSVLIRFLILKYATGISSYFAATSEYRILASYYILL